MRHHDALQFYPASVPPSFAWLPFQKNGKETPFAPEQTPSCVRLRDTSLQKDFPYTTDVCHSQYECCDTAAQGTSNMSLRTHSPSFPLIEIDEKLHELAKWAELVGLSLPSWEEYLNDREGLASRRECTSREYRGWPRRGQGDPAEWVDQSILTMVEALDYLMLGYDTATLHCIGMEPKKTVGKTAVDESAEYIKQCIANCAFRVAVRAVISDKISDKKPSITINLQNLPFERESSAWLVDKMAKNCRRANLINVQMASFDMEIQRTDKDGENEMKCKFGRKKNGNEKWGTLIFVSESEGINSPWSVRFEGSTGYARFSPLKTKQFRPTNAQIKSGVDQLMKVKTRPLKARRIIEEQTDPWPGTNDRKTMTGEELQGDTESFIMNATVMNGLCSHIYKERVTNGITNFHPIAVYCATQNPDTEPDALKRHEWRQKPQERLLPDDHTPHDSCSIKYCDYWGISDEAVYRLPSTQGQEPRMIVYNRTKQGNTAQSEQIEMEDI